MKTVIRNTFTKELINNNNCDACNMRNACIKQNNEIRE